VTRWAFLLLPLLGLFAADALPPDGHALKSALLMAGCFACVACALEARRVAWAPLLSAALWIFVAVRGWMLLHSPMTGRSLRWWSLLLALVLAHHAACAAVPRRWLRTWAPRVLGPAAAVLGALALLQALRGQPAAALFANRNFAGAGLAMLLPWALAARRGRLALFALAVTGLGCTLSRGGLLAAAAAVALWTVWGRRALRYPVLVGLPACVLAGGLLLGQTDTVRVRFAWYDAALTMGRDHLLAGLGADGFQRAYPPVRPAWEYDFHKGAVVDAVHDDYLESFAEGGLPGLAAHLLLLGAAAWALRRRRAACCSLLALAVASLVDQPLRDPSLLALAFLPLAFAHRRRGPRWPTLPLTLAALCAIGLLLPAHAGHWLADRAFGRYLGTHDRAYLDEALAREPRHPDALLARSRTEDLEKLLAMEPHNARARFNRTRFLPDDQAAAALRAILRDHDPNDRRTMARLEEIRQAGLLRRAREAEALLESEPVRALSLLDAVVQEGCADPLPYLLLARLHRRGGNAEAADRCLREAEARGRTEQVAEERLAFEQEELAQGRAHPAGIARAGRALDALRLAARIDAELRAAEQVEEQTPPPHPERLPAEDAAAYARRLNEARLRWREDRLKEARPHVVVARVLAEVLAEREPTPDRFRLVARAARLEGDLDRARQMEAIALFVETLEALRDGDEALAGRRFERARRAYPGLPEERTVARALAAFVARAPEVRPAAERLFAAWPPLRDALRR